jgi:quercetin dioxygenase-like cupin family protein
MARVQAHGAEAAVLRTGATAGEAFRPGFERWIVHTDRLMAVVLEISGGPWKEPDPPHSHPHEQIAYVVEGEILFICEGLAPTRLVAGDLYAIPPDVPHTIQLLSATARLVDCFTPLREDFLAKE